MLTYEFEARQEVVKNSADAYTIGISGTDLACADELRARGDLIVTLCKSDSQLRFYDADDLGLITAVDVSYEGLG